MKALFVSRHNNDYDSMAPVADGWVARSPANSAVFYFPTPEIAWKDDFRTAELRDREAVVFKDLWDIAKTGAAGRWVRNQWPKVTPERRLLRKSLQIATETLIAPRFSALFNRFLSEYSPDIIAFDWYPVPDRRPRLGHFGYQHCLQYARAQGIPVVSLPHGLVLYDQPQAGAAKLGAYDAMFVESNHRRDVLLQNGGELPPIHVTGSPRYDPSWVERVVRRLQGAWPSAEKRTADRVSVVYFGKKQVYEFDFAQQNAWLAELAAHPKVDLVIQPHPRGQKASAFGELLQNPSVVIESEKPASVLIDRADIVSTLTSSVVAEAAVRGREILYPRFFNTVVTRFEECDACIAIDGPGATHLAIDRYLAGDRVARENYERFLAEAVYGGPDGGAINRICDIMTKLATEASASRKSSSN